MKWKKFGIAINGRLWTISFHKGLADPTNLPLDYKVTPQDAAIRVSTTIEADVFVLRSLSLAVAEAALLPSWRPSARLPIFENREVFGPESKLAGLPVPRNADEEDAIRDHLDEMEERPTLHNRGMRPGGRVRSRYPLRSRTGPTSVPPVPVSDRLRSVARRLAEIMRDLDTLRETAAVPEVYFKECHAGLFDAYRNASYAADDVYLSEQVDEAGKGESR